MTCALLAPDRGAAADWRGWDRYMDWGQRAFEQGREATAESWFKRAVEEAEKVDARDPRLGQSLRKLLEMYGKQRRPDDVRRIEERLVAAGQSARKVPTGADISAALDAYSTLLKEMGRPAEAGAIARSAERFRRGADGQNESALLYYNPVADLRAYSALLTQRNRMEDAHAIDVLASAVAQELVQRYAKLRRGVAAESALPSLTHLRLVNGGDEALRARLYPEAEAFFTDAVKTAEGFTGGDVTLAHSISLLALSVAAQDKRAEFEAAVQRAMPILERAGLTHGLVLPSLRVLAIAHLGYAFDPPKTQAHLARSLKIVERDLAPDNPTIGLHLAGLAATQLALEGPDKAKPNLERALAIADKQFLPEHRHLATALRVFAGVAAERGDDALAHAVSGRVVAILKRLLDPEHPEVVLASETQRVLGHRLGRPVERVVPLSTATVIPVRISGNATLVSATVNKAQRAALLVDTGASITLLRPLLFTRLGLAIPDTARREKVQVVGGRTVEVAMVTVASLQVGDATIENLEVAVGDVMPGNPDLDGLLGADFLQRFRMTLDKNARTLTLAPQ